MSTIQPESPGPIDVQHTAYGRAKGHHNAVITEIGPGTPCGEYMRRYWHPVANSAEVTTRPQKVRILGEDLILFRSENGNAGLLYPRCAHRGSNLFFGHVEKDGLRCCYHGWLFDVQGKCLDQPCEPLGGAQRNRVRQPWYPVEERYGLVFAYLGPPDRKPVLPRYDVLEDPAPGHSLFTKGGGGTGGFSDVAVKVPAVPYNWLQFWENTMDPFHVWILHSTFTEVAQFSTGHKVMPRVTFEYSNTGVLYHAFRDVPGGLMDRIGQVILPNVTSVGSVDLEVGHATFVGWVVPVDDTHFIHFNVTVGLAPLDQFDAVKMTPDGKTWSQMSEAEHQDYPGDFEAQSSQGNITLHSEEHLARSDRGLVMLRRLMTQQINAVQDGKDPKGVAFGDDAAPIPILAGNFIR